MSSRFLLLIQMNQRVLVSFGGVSRIWLGFTKASELLTLGPFKRVNNNQ
jgi:hypothetical protein